MKQFIIITGGSKGLGQELAKHFSHKSDVTVIIIGRNIAALKETSAYNPSKINYIQTDIGTSQGRHKIIESLPSNAKISYIIHNAAVLEACELKDLSLESWHYQLAVNLDAPIFLTQQLLPHISENGRILNISTGFAHKPAQGLAPYCISKSALYMAYQCLALELKKYNVFVGSLSPGLIDTSMQERLRSLNEKVFPMLPAFLSFKEDKKLRAPSLVAKFVEWVLCKTDPLQFSAQEWNIDDVTHHANWLYKNDNIEV